MTLAQRNRQTGFRASLRVRGRTCFLLPERSEFKALLTPIDPMEGGVDTAFANGTRIHVPADTIPAQGIRPGSLIEDDAGRIHTVGPLVPSDLDGLRAWNCETSERTDATPNP